MNTQLEEFLKTQGLQATASLAHFGIKGMKWGIRRSDDELARLRGSASTDAIRARETLESIRKNGSLSAASDSDLGHLINRINLEKRYAEINPSIATKGHNSIKSLLSVGDTLNKAIQFSRSPGGALLADALHLPAKQKIGRHTRINK